MKEEFINRKSKENMGQTKFVLAYCFILLAIVIGIKAIEFKLNDFPIDVMQYSSSEAVEEIILININTADPEQLCQLPQIGESIAERIVIYREENGYFTDIRQITKVKGIGETTFEKICDLITVG